MTQTEAKRALVVGLGLTGLSCARHLARRGYAVSVADSRAKPPQLDALRQEFPHMPVHTGAWDEKWFVDPGLLVVSPGISLNCRRISSIMMNAPLPTEVMVMAATR